MVQVYGKVYGVFNHARFFIVKFTISNLLSKSTIITEKRQWDKHSRLSCDCQLLQLFLWLKIFAVAVVCLSA